MTNWSQYQNDIFGQATSSSNLIIDAVAGSGKTTTAVELAKRIGVEQVTLLAFNKVVAEELKSRGLPYASTFHSAAYGVLKTDRRIDKPKVDGQKVRKLARQTIPDTMQDTYMRIALTLVSLAKQSCQTPDDIEMSFVIDAINHHSMEFDPHGDEYQLFKFVKAIFQKSVADLECIDFDDMLYLPWHLRIPFRLAPTIIIDEAQDTNKLQRELLHTSSARIIAVGDPYQSIYGFRGADSNALDAIGAEFDCTTLPLSVCYRCDEAIVDEARTIVPHIRCRDDAPSGLIIREGERPKTSTILCRTNAPLIRSFYDLVRQKTPAKILGRDIGSSLIKTLDTISDGCSSILSLQNLLSKWFATELRAVERRGGSPAVLEDKYDCMNEIIDGTLGLQPNAVPSDVINSAALLFSDEAMSQPNAVILSSVHKAKGQEWDSVTILGRETMPSKFAKQDWQLRQEHNIIYVAITRAKHTLVYQPIKRKEH